MTAVPDNSPNVRAHTGKAVGRAYYAWRLCFLEGSFRMIIDAHHGMDNSLQPGPVRSLVTLGFRGDGDLIGRGAFYTG
jgi:hypothetical protein